MASLGAIVFASGGDLFSGPAETIEFFGADALCAEDGVFNAKLDGAVILRGKH